MIQRAHVSFDFVFERAKLLERVKKQELSVLSGTGAYCWRIVRNSMKQGRKKPAPPGRPPRYWTKRLKEGIYFDVDKPQQSVVIGATPNNGTLSVGSRKAPELLEHGGTVTVKEFGYQDPDGRIYRRQGRSRRKVQTGTKTYTMQARPFVGMNSINWPKTEAFWKKKLAKLL